MMNVKHIAMQPGLIEGVDGKKYERVNTQPYRIHQETVSDFHDLEGLPVELEPYLYVSDKPLTCVDRSSFAFKNVLEKAAQLLSEDEFQAAFLHMFISERIIGKQHVLLPWHSHNFSQHHGKNRDSDKMLLISSSNPTQIVNKRNLLVPAFIAKKTNNHLYPDFAQNVLNGNYGEVVSACPGQFLEIRENEAHISSVEKEQNIAKNTFRVFIALYIQTRP